MARIAGETTCKICGMWYRHEDYWPVSWMAGPKPPCQECVKIQASVARRYADGRDDPVVLNQNQREESAFVAGYIAGDGSTIGEGWDRDRIRARATRLYQSMYGQKTESA
jgi:hypothetical protein